MKKIGLALVMMFVVMGVAMGQDDTSATIVGTISDSAGAGIPNATVTVTNTRTNQSRKVQANSEGLYTVYPLVPGDYTVLVEQDGFKKSLVNVKLATRDRRPVDIMLEVGTPSETVTVTSEPPLIQDSPVGQTLVSGNQVTELPLNNRNFIRLLETVPGVSSDLDDESNFGLTSRASVSINGQRRNSVNYIVDGVNNVDIGSNITLLSTPTVDSIQEFKVLSSNYTADVGRSGGGSVIITTKGGGNEFHGTVYEFVRNDRFNANTFFNNRLGRSSDGTPVADVPRLRYNNFGGVISGPVLIPNVGDGGDSLIYDGRNRTFFFVSEEVRRITRATSSAGASVPSLAQRTGDFSANLGNLICRNASGGLAASTSSTSCTAAGTTPIDLVDTAGNTIQLRAGQVFRQTDNVPFAGNIISSQFIDSRSVGLLAAYPLPNNGINGFTTSQTNTNNTRQEVFRVDHNFNDNHKVFGRLTFDTSDTTEFGGLFTGFALPDLAKTETKVPGKVLALNYSAIFNPNLVNQFQFNYSGNEIGSTLVGRGRRSDYAGAELIQEYFPENNENVIPTISGAGFSNIGALQGYSIEYASTGFSNVLTWTKGSHTLKFGGEMTWEVKNENAGSNSQGTFGFSALQSRGVVLGNGISATNNTTGHTFASFLMGRANSYSEAATDFRVHERFGRREFFVQDTWKVRPNLTVDLGVRYQFFVPVTDRDNQIGTFDPELYDPSKAVCTSSACTAMVLATTDPNNGFALAGSTSRFGRKIHPSDYNNFSPRVGIAWDPFSDGKTIVRAGYGFYYDQALVGIFEQAAFTTPAFNPNVSFTSTASSVITYDDVDAGAPPGTLPLRSTIAIANDFETPEIQQWSVGIQREIFKNAVVDVSYVGTKGDKLIRQRDINFVTPEDVVDSGTTSGSSVRPFKGYTTITYRETSAKSRYNGLLSSFNYRLERGFTITAAYTLSKAMTDSTNDRDAVDNPQNPFDTSSEYAEARTSRRHIFSASYVYELPFFRNASGFTRALLEGWQVSGITQIESGAPVPRVTVASTLNGTRGLYPNMIGDPTGGLVGTTDPVTGLPFVFDPTVFEPAAAGEFGNAPRSFARLPGRNQTNLALMKQFYFNTERTFYLQIRGEAFNLFNQTQFTGIGTTLPTAGPLSSGATIGRPTSARLPREFQFGAKLYF
ncbi:MAG TPA: carboxypeptidase regulatory-like domain-containing protein [Pyrinomonadaceae bacterium]